MHFMRQCRRQRCSRKYSFRSCCNVVRNAIVLLAVTLLVTCPASAQEARPTAVAVDTVASVDETIDEAGNHVTGAFFDSVASIGLGHRFEAVVRPYVQRLPTGEWNRQIWLATLRYER